MHIPSTLSPLTSRLIDANNCLKLAVHPDTDFDHAIILLIRAKELIDDATALNTERNLTVKAYVGELDEHIQNLQWSRASVRMRKTISQEQG